MDLADIPEETRKEWVKNNRIEFYVGDEVKDIHKDLIQEDNKPKPGWYKIKSNFRYNDDRYIAGNIINLNHISARVAGRMGKKRLDRALLGIVGGALISFLFLAYRDPINLRLRIVSRLVLLQVLDHIPDIEQCHRNPGQCLHLHARLSHRCHSDCCPDSSLLNLKVHLQSGDGNRVAEWDQTGRVLDCQDGRQPGCGENVPLLHLALFYGLNRGLLQPDRSRGSGLSEDGRLFRDIHHSRQLFIFRQVLTAS